MRLAWLLFVVTIAAPLAGANAESLASSPDPDEGRADSAPPLAVVARALVYAGLALAFGGAACLLWMQDPFPPRSARLGILIGAGLHAVGIPILFFATQQQSGLGAADFAAAQVGRILVARILLGLAAVLLALVWRLPDPRVRAAPAVVAGLLVAAGVLSSRLGKASAQGVAAIALDAMHLLSAGVWVGGLALFATWAVQSRPANADLRAVGLRFSTLALTAVILMALSGLGTTILIVGADGIRHPAATLASTWGKTLAAKIALAVVMVALAAVNRFVFLAPRSGAGLSGRMQRAVSRLQGFASLDSAQPTAFRRIVAVEASFGAAIIVLAGLLTAVGAPQDTAASAAYSASAIGESFIVTLRIDERPAVGAVSELRFTIRSIATGAAETQNTCGRDPCVQVVVTAAGSNGTETHTAVPADGEWRVPDVLWTRAGTAQVSVRIQTVYVPEDIVQFEVPVS